MRSQYVSPSGTDSSRKSDCQAGNSRTGAAANPSSSPATRSASSSVAVTMQVGQPSSPSPGSAAFHAALVAYTAFLKEYTQYQLTWILDALRRTDFARLDRNGETYVDYMGGSLYPESLIQVHANFLQRNILGNTHSVSNS